MNVLNRYNIAYRGLNAGKHNYSFEMGDDFFEAFGNAEIFGGKAHAEVELNKTASGMMLLFSIKGSVRAECDRCLEQCDIPVDFNGELAVKFTSEDIKESEGYDGEVMWAGHGDHEINVAQYIYESIVLSLPMQRFHPDRSGGRPGCDPAVLEKAGIISEEEFARRAAAEEQYAIEDSPAGEALRALKDKLEDKRQ